MMTMMIIIIIIIIIIIPLNGTNVWVLSYASFSGLFLFPFSKEQISSP
jgi:hypothetical protein